MNFDGTFTIFNDMGHLNYNCEPKNLGTYYKHIWDNYLKNDIKTSYKTVDNITGVFYKLNPGVEKVRYIKISGKTIKLECNLD